MIIELRNCSLEISYIGTQDEIMTAMLQKAGDAMCDFARRCWEAMG